VIAIVQDIGAQRETEASLNLAIARLPPSPRRRRRR